MSCGEDEGILSTLDPCSNVTCQNGGTCNDGVCECPEGYSGTNCETEDLCITNPIACQNGGTCNEGVCDCPEGYIGENCEGFDPSQVQALLEGGQTPIELVNGGVPIDSLYGKMYEGGFIFYLNTDDGTGMVAATEDQNGGNPAVWGCVETDIMGLSNVQNCPGMGNCQQPSPEETEIGARIGDGAANTSAILDGCNPNDGIAAKLCRDLGAGWFLPSRGELNLMYTNLKDKGDLGGFAADIYWSSAESGNFFVWSQDFNGGNQTFSNKVFNLHVRAARAF